MTKAITILDPSYIKWVKELCSRYRSLQIKAAVKVNQCMLQYYWELGRDICNRQEENKYGTAFYTTLSRDLRHEMPGAEGLSERTIRYAKDFYLYYNQWLVNLQQPVADLQTASDTVNNDKETQILQQPVADFRNKLFSIPWGHHITLMTKFRNNPEIAWFYVNQTLENGWSRGMMSSFIETGMHERTGKALTNFKETLPAPTSDLAREITKDPYNFAFAGIRGKYNERLLKDALLKNITEFLIELGTGFAYVGKEYRLQIGSKEKFIDLLFYNLKLSCYVVIEVKIGSFDFADMGQLSGYVVACNHMLRKEGRDNPTIGLLICKDKDNLMAQYALESSNLPIGISSFELAKLYPENVEGTIPSTEEIEAKLEQLTEDNQCGEE